MTNLVQIFPKIAQRGQKYTNIAPNGQILKYFPHKWSQFEYKAVIKISSFMSGFSSSKLLYKSENMEPLKTFEFQRFFS